MILCPLCRRQVQHLLPLIPKSMQVSSLLADLATSTPEQCMKLLEDTLVNS
ncbi:unnamed protein product [Protopolystoma xenopodis]|uniref:Uncharacterized protein n=1 Tax=Protopolystoma xenopodis TaxID=117903 RepID=A0A3S5AFW3_9PLAT|nr:unnamed protein product [Protopolystoma xenopodis]